MINNDSRLLIIDALIQPCQVLDPGEAGSSLNSSQMTDQSNEGQDLAPYPLSQSFGAGNEFNMVSIRYEYSLDFLIRLFSFLLKLRTSVFAAVVLNRSLCHTLLLCSLVPGSGLADDVLLGS